MRHKLSTLSLGLLLAGLSGADESVARVQSINPAHKTGPSKLTRRRPPESIGFPVSVNTTGYIKDHYITDRNTVAALELIIGGRVGINTDTDIQIINDRSVANGTIEVKRIILNKGSLWIKADAQQLKQPIEIQTNGGVMGIRGTELTIDTQPDGSTRLCCFESNSDLGGVDIRNQSGKVIHLARPGDMISIKKIPVVTPHPDLAKFREAILKEDLYRGMATSPYFIHAFGGSTYVPDQGSAFYEASLYDHLERNPNYAAARIEPPNKPDFPSHMSPDAFDKSGRLKRSGAGPFPSFTWAGVEGAQGYVVIVANDGDCENVVFTQRVTGTSARYSPKMRPLEAGLYYWRVIPVNQEDKPVHRGSQTVFMVAK